MKRRLMKKIVARRESDWRRALKRNRGWHYLATCKALMPWLNERPSDSGSEGG